MPGGPRYTPEFEERYAIMRRTMTRMEVVRQLGIPYSSASLLDSRNGLVKRKKKDTTPISKQVKRRYTNMRLGLGMPQVTQDTAAKLAGISVQTAVRIEKTAEFTKHRKTIAPAPIPYDDLPEDARKALADFNFYRYHYKNREPLPWAGMLAGLLLDLLFDDEDHYVLLNACPGVGKTTILLDFNEWVAIRERSYGRELTALLGHRTDAMSKRYIRRIRHDLAHNRELIANFGRFKPDISNSTWSQEELLIEPLEWDDLTEKDPTFAAASQEMGFIGGRFKLNTWDDLVDKRNTRTPEARRALVEMFETEAETRLNTPGLLILSGARYGPEDLFADRARLVNPEELDPDQRPKKLYLHYKYPGHVDSKCQGNHAPGVPPWPEGCLLDPKRAPYSKLLFHKAKNEGNYRLVWQQEDVDPEGGLADPKWFDGGEDFNGLEVPGCFEEDRSFGQLPNRPDARNPLASALTVDPSAVEYWAVSHMLLYPGDIWYVLRGLRQKLKAPDLLYQDVGGEYHGILEDWYRKSSDQGVPFRYLVWEARGSQGSVLQYEFFRNWLTTRGVVLVRHDTHSENKMDREVGVWQLGPVFKEGRLRIPRLGNEERLYADQFRREACAWPHGATEDLVMHFWFLKYRETALKIAAQAEPDNVIPLAPGWTNQPPPPWVSKSFGVDGSPAPTWAEQRMAETAVGR